MTWWAAILGFVGALAGSWASQLLRALADRHRIKKADMQFDVQR
jgi:hypothetical protein